MRQSFNAGPIDCDNNVSYSKWKATEGSVMRLPLSIPYCVGCARYRPCGWFTCGQAGTLSSAVLLHLAHKGAHLHFRAVLQLQAVGLQQRSCNDHTCTINAWTQAWWWGSAVMQVLGRDGNILRGLPGFQNQMFHCRAFPVQPWSCASKKSKYFISASSEKSKYRTTAQLFHILLIQSGIFTSVGLSSQPVSWRFV